MLEFNGDFVSVEDVNDRLRNLWADAVARE